jgi:hypothetical protein
LAPLRGWLHIFYFRLQLINGENKMVIADRVKAPTFEIHTPSRFQKLYRAFYDVLGKPRLMPRPRLAGITIRDVRFARFDIINRAFYNVITNKVGEKWKSFY